MADRDRRPFGVTLLALLIFVVGIGMIVRGVIGLIQGGEGGAGILVAIVLLVVGLAYLLLAKGIHSGNRVSRFIVTILTAFALVGSVFTLMEPGEVVVSIVQIVVSVVILAMLYGRKARLVFA